MSFDHGDPLLRRFVQEESESAFGELVRANIDAVYATALRLCNGRAAIAEDITQSVFTDLARKAKSLRPGIALAGWLHRATRLAAAAALRSERRRSFHEAEAGLYHEMNRPESAPDWNRVRPILDNALENLKGPDREALLLRFFHRRSLREVGGALGVSEDAARMRIDRALDKLRAVLAGRGIPSTAAALGLILDQNAGAHAPAALANAIPAAAMAAAAIPTAAGFMTALFSMSAAKSIATVAATAAVLAIPIVSQHGAISRLREENARLAESANRSNQSAPTAATGNGTGAESLRLEVARLRAEAAKVRDLDRQLAAARAQLADQKASANATRPLPDSPAARNAKLGADFLAQNAKRPGVQTTASGLQYEILQPGKPDGRIPGPSDNVKVHYSGTRVDGTVFDSSIDRGEPTTFPLNAVIKGWSEGLQLMSEGAKYKLAIPSELAYGEKGAGSQIEPNSVLVFEIELLSVEPR